MSKHASDYKAMVTFASFLAPVFGGAIVYYSLRRSHETMAKLGNNMSWLAFVIWIAAFVGLGQIGVAVPQVIPSILGVTGIVLAIVTVFAIKKTSA